MDAIYHFWGKAAGERDGEPASHPLVYHCLDVAAMADALLTQHPQRLDAFARFLRTTPDNARRVLIPLVTLHDVGTFAETFQCKSKAAWPTSALGPFKAVAGARHDKTGFDMRDAIGLREQHFAPAFIDGWADKNFRKIWVAIAAHHGKPVQTDAAPNWDAIPGLGSKGLAAARQFTRQIAEHFADHLGAPGPLGKPDKRELATASWLIAGLTVLSDWLGSSRHHFPYQQAGAAIPSYWTYARKQADHVLAAAGLPPPYPAPSGLWRRLARLSNAPTPRNQGWFRDGRNHYFNFDINDLVVGCVGSLARTGLEHSANNSEFRRFSGLERRWSRHICTPYQCVAPPWGRKLSANS